MEYITVTDAMRHRVLGALENTQPRRRGSRRAILGVCAAAACLILIVASVIPHIPHASETDGTLQHVVSSTMETASMEALTECVGFTVEEVGNLPFAATDIQYTAYPGPMAQICYQGDEDTLTFRKLAGTGDPSGDFNTYSEIQTLTVDRASVTLKGDLGHFYLALWESGGYSYSLHSVKGYDAGTWDTILQSIQ